MSITSDKTSKMEMEEILYQVEKIVGKRIKKGKVEYLVRWKDYSPETDSWEPLKPLKETCYPLINDYNKLSKDKNSTKQPYLSQKMVGNNNIVSTKEDIAKSSDKVKSSSLVNGLNGVISNCVSKSLTEKVLSKTDLNDIVFDKSKEMIPQTKNKTTKKMVLYLEDNEIEEPPMQKSQLLKINGCSPNSVHTCLSIENTKSSSPITSLNSNSTQKSLSQKTDHTRSYDLKRKFSTNSFDSLKKLKLFDKESRSGDDTLEENQIYYKSSCDLSYNPILSDIKLDKCLRHLPYQRHKDFENLDGLNTRGLRRRSARQMVGVNRYREIIVRKDTSAGFTEISLYNRSPTLPNCFSVKILNELSVALKRAINDSSRIVLLSAVGKVFSSGIDLESIVHNIPCSADNTKSSKFSTAQLASPPSHNQYLQDLAESLQRFLLQLLNFPKTIVVAVNGPAIGLGCAILPLCDLVYATESSSFHLPYASLSQFPEGGTSVTLSMLIGMPAANQLLLGGRRWSAKEALNRGLISEIIFSEKFKAELFSRCKKLASMPSMNLETMKCMLRYQYKERIEAAINIECKKLLEAWRTSDFLSSAQSFMSKELPNLLS